MAVLSRNRYRGKPKQGENVNSNQKAYLVIFATMVAFVFMVAPGDSNAGETVNLRRTLDDDDDNIGQQKDTLSSSAAEADQQLTDFNFDNINLGLGNDEFDPDPFGEDPDVFGDHEDEEANSFLQDEDTEDDFMWSEMGSNPAPSTIPVDEPDDERWSEGGSGDTNDVASDEDEKDSEKDFAVDDMLKEEDDITTGPIKPVIAPEKSQSEKDYDELRNTVAAAAQNLEEAKGTDLEKIEPILKAAVEHAENKFKFGLGKLFGDDDDDVSTDDMETIAADVSKRLENEVITEVNEKAEEKLDEKLEQISQVEIHDEASPNVTKKDAIGDIRLVEARLTESLKEDIEAILDQTKHSLQQKADEIEEEILNEFLKPTGKHVEIREGKIKMDAKEISQKQMEPGQDALGSEEPEGTNPWDDEPGSDTPEDEEPRSDISDDNEPETDSWEEDSTVDGLDGGSTDSSQSREETATGHVPMGEDPMDPEDS